MTDALCCLGLGVALLLQLTVLATTLQDRSWAFGEGQAECAHEWVGHKNPDTPDGPGEWVEYCKHCGMENPGQP